jgi:hypothetical protein
MESRYLNERLSPCLDQTDHAGKHGTAAFGGSDLLFKPIGDSDAALGSVFPNGAALFLKRNS